MIRLTKILVLALAVVFVVAPSTLVLAGPGGSSWGRFPEVLDPVDGDNNNIANNITATGLLDSLSIRALGLNPNNITAVNFDGSGHRGAVVAGRLAQGLCTYLTIGGGGMVCRETAGVTIG